MKEDINWKARAETAEATLNYLRSTKKGAAELKLIEVVEAAKGWLIRYEDEVRDPSEEAPCKRLVAAIDALNQKNPSSQTPRTDALLNANILGDDRFILMTDLARQLERELAAAPASERSGSRQDYELKRALFESVKLQSHYAELLNMHDGGTRMSFTVESWLARLVELAANEERLKHTAEEINRRITLEDQAAGRDNAAQRGT